MARYYKSYRSKRRYHYTTPKSVRNRSKWARYYYHKSRRREREYRTRKYYRQGYRRY